jgi:hypothetical protein
MGKLKRKAKKKRREAIKRLHPPPERAGNPDQRLGGPPPLTSAQLQNRPLIASTPILYSDLADHRPAEEELAGIIALFEKRPTFFMLCVLNTFLSFYTHDIPNATQVQKRLVRSFLSHDFLKRIERKFARDSVILRPVFHRQQLLAVLKKVLVESANDGKVNPNPPENITARFKLGEACLMMNDLLFPEEQSERLKSGGGPEEDDRIHGELFAQWLPTFELLNPPDVMHSLVRNLEYARIFDERFSDFIFSGGQSLSQRFEQLTGLELKRYLVLIFNFYLFYQDQSSSLDNLVRNPALFNVDKRVVFAKMKLTEREVEAFFDLTAADVDTLIQEFQTTTPTKHSVFAPYDFTPFRRHPLVYNSDERQIVTCIDPAFLAEKISTGAYHTILRSLEVEESIRTKADESDRTRFLRRYWGDVFQIYVNDRLRDVFPLESRQFYASPKWDSPKVKSNEEAFDGVLALGDSLVVMEDKGKYLEFSAKYSGQRDALLADLHERFGVGVQQLADSLEVVFNNDPDQPRHTFSERDKENQPQLTFSLDDAERVRIVYPVLVVQDFSLQTGFANRELRNLFEREIKTRRVDPELVRPLSLLTVEDLETLIPYLDEVSVTDILDEYIKPHEPLYTFEHVLNAYIRRRKLAYRGNKWIDQRFEELRLSIADWFSVID